MKKLLTALLLTFILTFTYSCSDMAGNPSSDGPDVPPLPPTPTPDPDPSPDPDPEVPDPDDEVIETGKEWKNIKFLDNVAVPTPADITVVDQFIVSTAPGTETVTQTEAIVNTYTYDQFKTYITALKTSKLYTDKTHSKIVHILGETVLIPDTLADTKSTYFVFDNDTHYAIVTFYGDNYVDATRSTARPNLSVKLTRKDPFSKIGGKLKVLASVPWADIVFQEGADIPAPAGNKADLVIYDNATDRQEITIDIKSMGADIYKTYLNDIQKAENKFTRHKAIPSSAATGISIGIPNSGSASKSATWVVTDKYKQYISIAYIGEEVATYEGVNFKIIISKNDPFNKGADVPEYNVSDTLAQLPLITLFALPSFIPSTGTVVTFNNTKYGKEIRFQIEDTKGNYTAFRDYLGKGASCFLGICGDPKSGLTVDAFVNKSHPKSLAAGLGIAFGLAMPTAKNYTNSLTAAWSFVEEVNSAGVMQYTSFIWHGKNSPNNPYADNKAIFIIERMSHDPMWFLP